MANYDKKKAFDYANEIWNLADYVRNRMKRAEINKIVLPFALLRRLECALEPTRDDVIKAVEDFAYFKEGPNKGKANYGMENKEYCRYAKKSFYNTTAFRLNTLGSVDTLEKLKLYIDGFSPNAREILNKFEFKQTCGKLAELDLLYWTCNEFAKFDLSPENVSDREMSNIYEHLIEKYGEEIAEGAEDFMTPKDVVRLATALLFANDEELMNSNEGIVRTIYDPTMGTGGFITDALDLLDEWHKDKEMIAPASMVVYGQESEGESWAIGKTNIMLRNVSDKDADSVEAIVDYSENVAFGDTLADDKFKNMKFNYILSNPPFGKKWEASEEAVKEEAAKGFNGRFGAGLPSISDGSMLFLQHVVSKLESLDKGGGKAGIILSASPLFTGDAGTGPSNIRRWLFENDYIDCIIKLPTEIFFRTGIATYLWILTNKKAPGRIGKVQLIDASDMKTLLRKNLGKKRYEISKEGIDWIVSTYVDGHDHGNSVLIPCEDFMYRQVTTQRPLRAKIHIPEDVAVTIEKTGKMENLDDTQFDMFKTELSKYAGQDFPCNGMGVFKDVHAQMEADYIPKHPKGFKKNGQPKKVTFPLKIEDIEKWVYDNYLVKDPDSDPVYDKDGKIVPDPDLKDTEDIPWNVAFDDYMAKEVLPFTSDAWIDESATDEKGPLSDHKVGQVGTYISFNRYFYKYETPREPDVILQELIDMEKGMESSLKELL